MVDLHKEISFSDLLPKRSASKPRSKPVESARRAEMPEEIVGLKIEAAGLTAAQVVNNGGKKLVRVAQLPLEPGIVSGGEVRDPAGLATALNELFSSSGLPKDAVRLGLANSRIGVRTIEITGVEDDQQFQNAVRFRAHEILSTPLEEAVIDYHLLGSYEDEEGQTVYRVLLVLGFRDSIDRQLAATDAAGLEVVGIDLDAFALLRASLPSAAEHEGDDDSALVAVSIDHDLTTLAISDGSVCRFTRVLEWGTTNVDSALSRALKISTEEAVAVRKEVSLENLADTPAQGGAQPDEIVRRELQTLVRELLSSIRFFNSQPGTPAVRGFVVSGSLVDLPGFTRRLGFDLRMPVTSADPFGRVETAPEVVRPEQTSGLVVAVGLGIED